MYKIRKNFPIWTPHVTVGAVIAREFPEGTRYLMVWERTRKGVKLNQPAGHWECDESLVDAVKREVMEESGFEFTPSSLLGVYVSDRWEKDITYLRFAFIGSVSENAITDRLDDDIISAEWLSYDEIMRHQNMHRNPIVVQCLNDYRSGRSLDLDHVMDLRGGNHE